MPNLEGEEKVIKSNIKVSPPSCDNLYPALRGPQVPPPQVENTVYIGFSDQPPSQGSRSLNLIVVAKLSGFSLGLTTRWSLNPMYSILRWVQRPPKVSTVAISLHKGRNQRSLNTRSLCSTKKGPSRRFWSLKPDWPLYPQSQNPMLTV